MMALDRRTPIMLIDGEADERAMVCEDYRANARREAPTHITIGDVLIIDRALTQKRAAAFSSLASRNGS